MSPAVVWSIMWRCLTASGIVAALLLFGGEARAQTQYDTCYGNGQGGNCPDRQTAYDNVLRVQLYYAGGRNIGGCVVEDAPPNKLYRCEYEKSNGTWDSVVRRWPIVSECPAGSHWDEGLNKCVATCEVGEWNNPLNPAECLSQQKCQARNQEPGYLNVGETSRVVSGDNFCVAGCKFAPAGPSVSVGVDGVGGGMKLIAGGWEYSGDACDVTAQEMTEETAQTKEQQECVPSADGQTFCVRSDGQHCYQSSSGRLICWAAGETGTKTDQDVAQNRKPGESTTAPEEFALPNGEVGLKYGDTVVTRTEVTNPDGTTRTIITAVTNYKGDSGADAGDKNEGRPLEGGGGEGDSEDEGTASGGETCAAPPVCSGNAIDCAVLNQNWAIRCDDAGLGDDALAEGQALLAEYGDGSGEDPDMQGLEEHADPNGWRVVENITGSNFDESGFIGNRTCPVLPTATVGPTEINISLQPICDLLESMSGLIVAFAYYLGARIIAGTK